MINLIVSDIQYVFCIRTMEGHIQAQMKKALAEEEASNIGTIFFLFIFL